VPIYDFAIANKGVEDEAMEEYFPCCGKSICGGCVYSFKESGNHDKCPFCNSDRTGKTDEEIFGEILKRVEANDPASMCMLATHYHHGRGGVQQDHAKVMELYVRAADLGYKYAHHNQAVHYYEGGNLKKAKFHYEAAAMAGHDGARCCLGIMENKSENIERAIQHFTIAASSGHYPSMHLLMLSFQHCISRESIDTALAAYNSSCAEMRSEARDDYIRANIVYRTMALWTMPWRLSGD
jgi:TPR repeat protein